MFFSPIPSEVPINYKKRIKRHKITQINKKKEKTKEPTRDVSKIPESGKLMGHLSWTAGYRKQKKRAGRLIGGVGLRSMSTRALSLRNWWPKAPQRRESSGAENRRTICKSIKGVLPPDSLPNPSNSQQFNQGIFVRGDHPGQGQV